METRKKKNFLNKHKMMSGAKITDILLNPNYVENYIKYALQEDEGDLKATDKGSEVAGKHARNSAIDLQMKKLIEHLYSLKFKLEKEKKAQEKEKKSSPSAQSGVKEKGKIINSQKKVTLLQNEQGKFPKRISANNKLCRKCQERGASVTSPVPQLIETIEIYKNRNAEEQRNKIYLIEKYENMLRNIKKRHLNEINEIKNNILMDVDFLIQKYRNISLELLQISKEKEKEKVYEKEKITEICINACNKFEEDVKKRAKESMQGHEARMVKVINDTKREKEDLEKKIALWKKKSNEEKTTNEKRMSDIFEKKIKEEHALNEELKSRISEEQEQQNGLIKSLYSKVDSQIKTYEENIVRVFHSILLKNGIEMDLSELSQMVKEEMDDVYGDGNRGTRNMKVISTKKDTFLFA
ncbi:conserved Plasmodium protein, unknown function [Plasmodium ovale]|uniref:Uncharacterized protein n=1 Tax=Plasmodium ovale TaxID=36330 RepID=A0A1C3KUB7_PLAOA|nr:conserved Plasmodium protein, unknown function [Plasmodium ovale]